MGSAEPLSCRPAASVRGVTKEFGGRNGPRVVALDKVTASFGSGQFTAVMGPSGSGKSTLLHCLAGLDSPTSGEVILGEQVLSRMSDDQLTRLRRRIGFVFQSFNLIPTLTARENIVLPLGIAGRKVDPQWFAVIVERLGLTERLGHRPGQLSGGQQQRVACARALVGRPQIVFADEPTGSLDSTASAEILSFLRWSVDSLRQTVVMVTHDPVAASYTDRVLFLADGAVLHDLHHPTADAVLETMRGLTPGATFRRGGAAAADRGPSSPRVHTVSCADESYWAPPTSFGGGGNASDPT